MEGAALGSLRLSGSVCPRRGTLGCTFTRRAGGKDLIPFPITLVTHKQKTVMQKASRSPGKGDIHRGKSRALVTGSPWENIEETSQERAGEEVSKNIMSTDSGSHTSPCAWGACQSPAFQAPLLECLPCRSEAGPGRRIHMSAQTVQRLSPAPH